MADRKKASRTTREEKEERKEEDSDESESKSSSRSGKATHAITVQSLKIKGDDPDNTYMREDITVKGGDGKQLIRECLEKCHKADDQIPDGASAYSIQIEEAGTGDVILQKKVEGVESAREAIDQVIAELDKPAKKKGGR